MKQLKDKKTLRAVSVVILVFGFACAGAFAAKTAETKGASEELEIIAERAEVDMEAEEFSISVPVEIRLGDMSVKGNGLQFSNKTHIAVLTGNPVRATFGNEIKAEAGKIVVDIDKGRADISGGCKVSQARKDSIVDFETEKVEAGFGENEWAQGRNTVKIYYTKQEKQQPDSRKQSDGTDKPKKRPAIDTDEVYMTAGAFFYNFKTQSLEASQTVQLEVKDGAVTAEAMKGQLDKERIELTGGVQGRLKDIGFKAGRLAIDYGQREADLSGGVSAERDGGDRFQTEHLWFKYKEGERRLKLMDGVHGRLNVQKTKERLGNGPEKQPPEGGKP